MSHDRKQIILERSELSEGLGGKYVDLYEFPDGRLASRLADILCHREQRHVSQQLSLAYDRRQIILERSGVADGLAGQYVEVYDFADRPLEVRWKGHLLPYRVFSKDQRVSPPPSSRTSVSAMRSLL